ncbi:hypothetical protein D3C75_886200 [compost metagenome]
MHQLDPLQAGVHTQAVQAIARDRLVIDVVVQRKRVTELVQQPPFERAQQRLQRATGGQGLQGQGVVLEQRRERRFGGQQAHE